MATLLDILLQKGAITGEQASDIKKQARDGIEKEEDALLSLGVPEDAVYEAKSKALGIPVFSIEGKQVQAEATKNIPEESARYYKFVPLSLGGGVLSVGMLNPEDSRAKEALRFIVGRLGLASDIYLIKPSDFEKILEHYKTAGGEVTQALSQFQEELEETYAARKTPKTVEETGKTAEEAPVTKMVSVILRYGVEGGASDIHIEPIENNVKIRFRVDGVLYTGLMLPKEVHGALITRIKVLTSMKIDESRIPQDGRFHARILEKEIDFRVSTFPTNFGEKVAIRILDPSGTVKSIADLGLDGRNLETIKKNIKKPFGMILITGPTGSGKSTTLYALLEEIDRETKNVVSLEDPIEYYLPGVNQSQVRPEIKYDFATGLRHILRQDPDVIMVGEIRDKETAELAVHAALTGHLVLSTLHTNNAAGVIPRLIDMGIDPFLIPSTLACAVAQRLARKLCPESKKEIAIAGRYKEIIDSEINSMPAAYKEDMKRMNVSTVSMPEVSTTCPKGTRGRIGVFEVLEMTPRLEKIILEGPSEAKILDEAVHQGMITLRQDGIIKALHGIIGVDDLLEVT